MTLLRSMMTAPDPAAHVAELADEDLRRLLAELRAVKRANEWVAEAWAICQVEAAERFWAAGESAPQI